MPHDPANPAWVALREMTIGDALGATAPSVQILVAGLVVGTALWLCFRPGVAAGLSFLAAAAMWSRANQHFEVMTLWKVSHGHGLTMADLLVPVSLVPALLRWRWQAHRRSRRAQPVSFGGAPPAADRPEWAVPHTGP